MIVSQRQEMQRSPIKEYLEKDMLNPVTCVIWPEEEKKAFEGGKESLLTFCNYLERRFLVKGNHFAYNAGNPVNLREAVTFTIFSEAIRCYISVLHIGWNGHTTAAAMLVGLRLASQLSIVAAPRE